MIKRITLNPDVYFGKPTVRNMRYPVEMILDLLSAGMSILDAKWFGRGPNRFGQYILYLKKVWVPKPLQRQYNQELIEDYPGLEEEDIKACLLFASKLIKVNSISKVVAA